MRAKRAFTLTETMVVVGVLLILYAICYPALTAAKFSAKVSKSITNLRQLHAATMLYQADHGGGGVYGDVGSMGLPLNSTLAWTRLGLPLESFLSPCGRHPDGPTSKHQYTYWITSSEPDWIVKAQTYKENLMLFQDENCNDPRVRLANPHMARRGLGILLSGRVIHKIAAGESYRQEWWAGPQP